MNIKMKYMFLLTATFAWLITISPISFAATIPGWPRYLAMGTVTNNAPSVGDALALTPVDAIFKYAGNDGAGDPGIIMDASTAQKTVLQARFIEANSHDHHKVMPVLVFYTINLSGGMVTDDVTNNTYLFDHYATLINYCIYLESQKDAEHPHPATLIMNPDFLGTMQQSGDWSPLKPNTHVNVNEQLTLVLNQINANKKLPVFEDNMLGYIQSINWIIRTFAPDVTFGWQENIWSKNSASWVYQYTAEQVIEDQAKPVTDYINSLGVYQGPYKPNFIVFDRYERDDFYLPNTAWFYNRHDWQNYLTYVNYISRALNVPAILWQIPGGHMLTKGENTLLTLDHVATAPNFFFGETKIDTLLPAVLNFQVAMPDTKSAAMHLAEDKDQNWEKSELQTAINNNIVAILWGGGSTTGVVSISTNGDDGGWLANKIQDYYKNPIVLPVDQ